MKKIVLTALVIIMIETVFAAGGPTVRAVAESGFLAALSHKAQFGNDGTYFNYVTDGGQDVLFPVTRFSLEMDIDRQNTIILLYQPIGLVTEELLSNDLVVDSEVFAAGTPMRFTYNFPFYRLSYLHEYLPDNRKYDFAFGGSLQLRDATIIFASQDGEQLRTNRDVGPVPALKIRARSHVNRNLWFGLEADGIWAPISYLNGSDTEVEGAILDASLRSGYRLNDNANVFLNMRYIGGGAVGTGKNIDGPGDGYVKNWLHFTTLTAGMIFTF